MRKDLFWFTLATFLLTSFSLMATAPCTAPAGSIAFINGETQKYVCKYESNTAQIFLKHDAPGNNKYVYVITDENDVVLGYSENRSIPLDAVPVGNYKVWGVAYSGNKIRNTGKKISETDFSNDCYSVSDNFVRILYDDLTQPELSLHGKQYYAIAEYDQALIDFSEKNIADEQLVYLVTNYRKRVIGMTHKAFDFTNFGIGKYKVYAYQFTGQLSIQVGDFMMGDISEGCFQKSKNYLTIDKKVPAGFPILPDDIAPLSTDDVMFASSDDKDFLAYATPELAEAEALAFDKLAAEQDARMLDKMVEKSVNICQANVGSILATDSKLLHKEKGNRLQAKAIVKPTPCTQGSIIYFLVDKNSGLLLQKANQPDFLVERAGVFSIHTLAANTLFADRNNYLDLSDIILKKSTFQHLSRKVNQSSVCADIDEEGTTFVIFENAGNCLADAGEVYTHTNSTGFEGTPITLVGEEDHVKSLPLGYKKIYLLTYFNEIIDLSEQAKFSVKQEGYYGIVALVYKADGKNNSLSLQKIKEKINSSIFQLIETIEVNKICASVSSWTLAEVKYEDGLSFTEKHPESYIFIKK